MNDTSPLDGVLFDMDGTLIDTVPFIVESFRHTFEQHHVTGVSDAHIMASIGTPLETYLRQFAGAATKEMVETYTRYNELWLNKAIALFLGVPAMLDGLHALPVRTGVVTAKRRVSAMLTLRVFDLESCFDTIVTKEDTTRHKPHPEPLLMAMKNLGLTNPSRVLYVGDSIHDIRSAHAAGCLACAVNWSRMPHEDLMSEKPHFWAKTACEIVDIASGRMNA